MRDGVRKRRGKARGHSYYDRDAQRFDLTLFHARELNGIATFSTSKANRKGARCVGM